MRCQVFAATATFALVLPLFSRLIDSGDHPCHVQFALDLATKGTMPPHPLFHAALFALTGGHTATALGMAALLLALAVAARAWLTAELLTEDAGPPPLAVLALCAGLVLALPLPNWWGGDRVLGQPSSNVWHNTTFLTAVPFALWLFGLATHLLARPALRPAALTGVVMALSLLAKPNYVLAFAPCFGPALLGVLWQARREGRVRAAEAFGVLLLAFVPAAAVMGAQARWLMTSHPVFVYPLAVWQRHSPDIPASIALGLAFPLAVFACYPRRAYTDQTMTLAWSTMITAVATFALLAESRGSDANWGWGCHLAAAVLFAVSAAFVLRQPADWRRPACFAVLAAHAVSGAAHLGECLARGAF